MNDNYLILQTSFLIGLFYGTEKWTDRIDIELAFKKNNVCAGIAVERAIDKIKGFKEEAIVELNMLSQEYDLSEHFYEKSDYMNSYNRPFKKKIYPNTEIEKEILLTLMLVDHIVVGYNVLAKQQADLGNMMRHYDGIGECQRWEDRTRVVLDKTKKICKDLIV